MTPKEYERDQQEAIKLALLIYELKKADPKISERLTWFLEGMRMAIPLKNNSA